ncbi:MAG: hypothetical protein AAFX09_03150 [Pseudomonadota bacterium]
MKKLLSAVSLAAVSAAGASAQDGRFEFVSDNSIGIDDPFAVEDLSGDPTLAGFDLEAAFDSNNLARWVQPLEGRAVLRFEQQVRGRFYLDRDDLNSLLLTPRVQFWNTTSDNRFQFRAYAAYSHMTRDGDTRWTRPEGEMQLRRRHDEERRNETVLRLRANAYDFEEGVVGAGLDQTRVRAGVEHFIRPTPGVNELRLSGFYEVADADLERNSFEEVRVAAVYRHKISPCDTLQIRLDLRDREYDGAFSAAFPVNRSDERFTAEVRVERQIAERAIGYASVGHIENSSNVPVRDYGGATFKLGVRAQF